jgi:hypothetical protein
MDSWQEREILKHYPEAKSILDLSEGYDSLNFFDGCGFVCPDVIFAKRIPNDRVSFLLYCRSIMHDKSILFVEVLQSDFNYVVKDAGMRMIKVFKEGLYFVYVIQK